MPRASASGAFVGLVAATACLAAVILWTKIENWWYGAFTCFPTFLIGWLASYAFPPPPPEKMRGVVYPSYYVEGALASLGV